MLDKVLINSAKRDREHVFHHRTWFWTLGLCGCPFDEMHNNFNSFKVFHKECVERSSSGLPKWNLFVFPANKLKMERFHQWLTNLIEAIDHIFIMNFRKASNGTLVISSFAFMGRMCVCVCEMKFHNLCWWIFVGKFVLYDCELWKHTKDFANFIITFESWLDNNMCKNVCVVVTCISSLIGAVLHVKIYFRFSHF